MAGKKQARALPPAVTSELLFDLSDLFAKEADAAPDYGEETRLLFIASDLGARAVAARAEEKRRDARAEERRQEFRNRRR
jgi:hypothetical protein